MSPSRSTAFRNRPSRSRTPVAWRPQHLTHRHWEAGQHAISATYNGDSNSDPSTAAPPLTQTVNTVFTTTTVGSSSNPSTSGQTVTFIATVAAAGDPPTGTVVFTIDDTAQPAVPLTVVGGQNVAALPDSSLSVGIHTIRARYSGDANFSPSTVATPLTQVVQAMTTTTLTAAPTFVNVGRTVTLTATVSGASPGGMVAFLDGQTALGNVPLGANDQAVLSVSTLAVGTHSIIAVLQRRLGQPAEPIDRRERDGRRAAIDHNDQLGAHLHDLRPARHLRRWPSPVPQAARPRPVRSAFLDNSAPIGTAPVDERPGELHHRYVGGGRARDHGGLLRGQRLQLQHLGGRRFDGRRGQPRRLCSARRPTRQARAKRSPSRPS